jgi:hypothetical protein
MLLAEEAAIILWSGTLRLARLSVRMLQPPPTTGPGSVFTRGEKGETVRCRMEERLTGPARILIFNGVEELR